MSNLIKIELFKESKKTIHYIFAITLIMVCGLTIYFCNKNYEPVNNFYETPEILSKFEFDSFYKKNNYNHYKSLYKEYVEIITIENKLSNNIKEKYIFERVFTISLFITLIISITNSGVVSNEFNKGTIKTMLTKPNKRYKVVLSKYISGIIITLFYAIIVFMSVIIFMKIICNFNILNLTHNFVFQGKIRECSYFTYIFIKYLIYLIPVFFISIIIVFFSTMFRNTAFNACASLFLSLMGVTIGCLLLGFKLNFIQYSFLPYLDFTIFNNIEEIFYMNINYMTNLSIKNGIIILLSYSLILIISSLLIFNKKDIYN